MHCHDEIGVKSPHTPAEKPAALHRGVNGFSLPRCLRPSSYNLNTHTHTHFHSLTLTPSLHYRLEGSPKQRWRWWQEDVFQYLKQLALIFVAQVCFESSYSRNKDRTTAAPTSCCAAPKMRTPLRNFPYTRASPPRTKSTLALQGCATDLLLLVFLPPPPPPPFFCFLANPQIWCCNEWQRLKLWLRQAHSYTTLATQKQGKQNLWLLIQRVKTNRFGLLSVRAQRHSCTSRCVDVIGVPSGPSLTATVWGGNRVFPLHCSLYLPPLALCYFRPSSPVFRCSPLFCFSVPFSSQGPILLPRHCVR